MTILIVGVSLFAFSSTSSAALFEVGTSVAASAQFSGAVGTTTIGRSFSTTSVTSTGAPGTAFASARYNGALRVEANSAPSGTGDVFGDSMVAHAEMTTLNRILATPGGPLPGELVDIRMDYGVDGQMIDLGSTGSTGNMSYLIQLGRESITETLLNGFLFFNPSGRNPVSQDFGPLDPVLLDDIATGSSFVNVGYSGSSIFQVAVGEEFTVRAILMSVTGGTMRSTYLNTANFSLTSVTAGVTVEVVPVPEPSVALLMGLGLVGLATGSRKARGSTDGWE